MLRRKDVGYLGGLIGVFGNLGIFLLKLYMGIVTSSVSITADAFHTFSDMGTSLIVILGFYFAYRGVDEKHPYGHGRAEYVSSLFISIILIIFGADILLDSYLRLGSQPAISFSYIFLLLLVVTIIAKELMAYFVWKMGRNIESLSLQADAWHHLSDALTTIGVIVAILLANYGFYYADTIMGILIAILLIFIGGKIARESVDKLLGRYNREIEKIVREEIAAVKDATHVHSIEIHDYGHTYRIAFHVKMDPSIPLKDAHQIATEIENRITARIPNSRVTVHMEPLSHPQ